MRINIFMLMMLAVFIVMTATSPGVSEQSIVNGNMSALNCMSATNVASQENITERENLMIVKQSYDDYLRGNISALISNYTDDSAWIQPGSPKVPFAGVYHGKAGIESFFQAVASRADITEFNIREYIPKGDEVVVIGSYLGRVKSNGKIFSSDWVDIVTLNNGKITKYQTYQDTEALVEAFGPSNGYQNTSALNKTI